MKIAIVARSPSSRYLAPFADTSWQVWTLSPQTGPGFCDLPRWDRWYELHHLEHQACENPGYVEWIQAQGAKAWLREPHEACPQANVFPKDAVLARTQQNWAQEFRYYTNSVSWVIGHALTEGATELAVYGVDMCQVSEYGHQKPSCEALLGYCAGAGVKVHVPEICDLFKVQTLYGLEDPGPWQQKLKVHEAEIEQRLSRALEEVNTHKKQVVGAVAAYGELEGLRQSLNGQASPELLTLLENRLAHMKQVGEDHDLLSRKADEDVKLYTGSLEEIRYQRQYL